MVRSCVWIVLWLKITQQIYIDGMINCLMNFWIVGYVTALYISYTLSFPTILASIVNGACDYPKAGRSLIWPNYDNNAILEQLNEMSHHLAVTKIITRKLYNVHIVQKKTKSPKSLNMKELNKKEKTSAYPGP